jgi:hypothetical protein
MNSRLSPDDAFPDLTRLPTEAVEVVNSKVHRELDFEYATVGDAHPETEFRLEEINDELDARDVLAD